MEKISVRAKRLLLLMLILLALYAVCRLLFIYANRSELDPGSFNTILNLLWGGMRFDLFAIAIANSLFLVMILFPAPFTTNKYYQKITGIIFILFNSLFLLSNLIDVAYFPYIHKRSQSDALLFITGEKGDDLFRLLPTFFRQFWYLMIVFLGLIWLLLKVYKKTLAIKGTVNPSFKSYLYSSLLFIIGIASAFIMIRGGLQAKPLSIIQASEMTEAKNIPAIINTPFSIIKTIGSKRIVDVQYFSEENMQSLNNGIHLPPSPQSFSKENVVIIIVESLSKKYLGYFGGKAHTPFLDSLFHQSMVFSNAFANAKQSIQGIPAILSSIPSWQDEPFIFSPYVSNRITSLPYILKTEGYETSFFHGGFNGTMGFDSYSGLAGFDHYYGRNEYGNEEDYDGSWGIWDEPFLQFMAKELNKKKEPFFSTVFTLNTHHQFIIPAKYKSRFNQTGHPFLNSIAYLDFSLSRFFETLKNKPWFKNTLFIITADHTAPDIENEPSSSMEDYRIPIAFYKPGDTSFKGTNTSIANQIDIMPSILRLLNYPNAYYAIGKSLFDSSDSKFAITYNGGIYQYIDSAYCYQFNGENAVAFYAWKSDSLLTNNLYHRQKSGILLKCDSSLKKMIQFFNNSMINNRMNEESIYQTMTGSR